MFVLNISEWAQEYHLQYPDTTILQTEVDEFMATFDVEKEEVHCKLNYFSSEAD